MMDIYHLQREYDDMLPDDDNEYDGPRTYAEWIAEQTEGMTDEEIDELYYRGY